MGEVNDRWVSVRRACPRQGISVAAGQTAVPVSRPASAWRPMARPRSEDRRKAILSAATRVIAFHWLAAATATIAKEARVAGARRGHRPGRPLISTTKESS
jgi:hypothetical protein